MKDFRQLKVWQRAHELTVAIYHVTATFPRDEIYGLVSQMRRASCSIASNIAEGCGREGDAVSECVGLGPRRALKTANEREDADSGHDRQRW